MNSGIYMIYNCANGKFYIGSAVNFKNRLMNHQRELNLLCHRNRHLQSAWKKQGGKEFEFHILEYVEDKNDLLAREQWWLDITIDRPRYNRYQIAGSPIGTKHTELSKKNMSEAHKGKKHTEESKRKKSVALKGRTFSSETIERMSEAQKNNKALRKEHKWPCQQGIRCKCEECVKKKSAYSLEWYHKNKVKKFIIVDLGKGTGNVQT